MIRIITTIFLFSVTSNYISAQTVTATQTDSLVGDHQAIGIANPKDTVRYKTTISVSGANATGVNFNNGIPTNTTMVAGSVKTSALCRDDAFATSFNTLLNTGNVITNDFGLPGVSVVSFGTTMSGGTTTLAGNAGTTNGGGTLTLNANGTFSYQPMSGFSGMDQFTYIGTTGVAGLQNGSATVTIDVATDITFTTLDTNPECNGASTGSIVFSASGGTGTLTYSITGAFGTYQVSPTFSGLTAGTYNLAVKDAVGYIKTGNTTLTNPPLITFSTMDVHNICNGGMAGSITFSAMGGTGTLMYSITGDMGTYQASNVFNGLAANTYNLAVKDASNCIVTGTSNITQPGAVSFTFTETDITCNGAGDGSIVFNTTSGGTSPYTYSITGTLGTFTGSISYPGLSAATYNLVAKDVNNCNSGVVSTTVTEPVVIVVSGTIPTLKYNVAMSNAAFSKTGGTGSPANPWSAIGLPTGVTINTATGVVSGTPTQTGSFSATITYTDANACFDDLSISVMVGPNLVTNTYPNIVGNTQLVADGYMPTPSTPFTADATNILTNDLSDVAITVTSGTFATVNGGSITIGTDGKFIYSPPVGNLSADSYTYTGTSNGVSGTGIINFTFGAGMIWFVNNTYAGANGAADGRSHRPFTSVNMAEAPSANDNYIYVHAGSGNTIGTIVLKPNQLLRGEGTALTVGVLGLSGGTKPTLAGMITLANSVTVDGFDMSNGATTAITSSGATGVNVSVGNVTTNGAPNAVSLTNTTGTVTIAGGSQTSSTGATVNISGGTVSLTYGGGITQAVNAPMVSVSGGHATGTIAFNSGVLSATNGTGLQFDNADGTYNFNGTTTLNGGNAGIDIQNGSGGSFTFGANTSVTSPTGIAVNIDGTAAIQSCAVTYSGNITQANNFETVFIKNHNTGTITFQTGTLSATNGTGFDFQNGDGTYNFNGTNTLNGGDASINISTASAGTYNFSANSSITNPTNDLINIVASTVNFTYSGSFTKNNNNAQGIHINQESAGTININGSGTKVLSTGTANAVDLTSNTGVTINFSGNNLLITTTSGVGFNATGGGTINVIGSGNTITSTTGTALNIANTTIGASNINFQSISANGGVNGIVLNTTGSTGGLIVTGTGAANSGGIIQNMVGADNSGTTPGGTGIVLNSTSNVSLTRMWIHDNSNYAIRGNSVNGFVMANCTIDGVNGNNVSSPFNDGSMIFNMLTGTVSITNNTVQGGYQRNISIDNQSGTLNLTMTGNTIRRTSDAAGDDGLSIEAETTANVTACITDNTFARHGGDHINISLINSAIVTATIADNIMQGNYSGAPEGNHPIGLGQGIFILGASFNGTFNYLIANNILKGTKQGGAIHVNKGSGMATYSGRVLNNTIGDTAIAESGASESSGIIIAARGTGGSHTSLVQNNSIYQYDEMGINLEAGEDGDASVTSTAAALNVTVTGNTISNPGPNALHGITLNSGVLAGDNNSVCVDIKNNNVASAGNEAGGGFDIRVRQRQATRVLLPGYAGTAFDNMAVISFVNGNNATATTVSASSNDNLTVTTDGYFAGGTGCTLPVIVTCPSSSVASTTRSNEPNSLVSGLSLNNKREKNKIVPVSANINE